MWICVRSRSLLMSISNSRLGDVLRSPFALILLFFVLSCSIIYFIVFWNSEAGRMERAEGNARLALPQINSALDRLDSAMPPSARLTNASGPDFGSYAMGLSDGADRYGVALATRRYRSEESPERVYAAFELAIKGWGWVSLPIDPPAEHLAHLFQNPSDQRIVVGLCKAYGDAPTTLTREYTVFVNFAEERLSEFCQSVACWVDRYCAR